MLNVVELLTALNVLLRWTWLGVPSPVSRAPRPRSLTETGDFLPRHTCRALTPAQRPARKLLHPSAMQRTAKRFVGEVVELSRNCELGQEGDRAVVTSLAFPYMSLTFQDRVLHTGADYKYLRTCEGTVDGSDVDLSSAVAPPALSGLHVELTAEEIRALPQALEHVRLHMAHQHPWDVRDAAMTAIGKLVIAARAPSRQENRRG